ncbi:MAG TPA: DNA repair protein RadA, partial [Burkholderiaceae bacterium]|nr:DNA repair protein RadA [Burkholderiaceae bacterium]
MSRASPRFVCSACGGASAKWSGQCPHCAAWNTLTEATAGLGATARAHRGGIAPAAEVTALGEVPAVDLERTSSGLDEFDRVLGGGLVEGGVVLIGGDPGIGKSTLLLQSLSAMARHHRVLYVSGEESVGQIALRAQRLGIEAGTLPQLRIASEIDLDRIIAAIERERPRAVVIDSIQTLYSAQLGSAPGSVSQVRECAAALTRLAKQSAVSLILVGHVTKEGALAGPRVLEHMVDTVLYFEGDSHSSFRLVRAFKNRFGAVNELGVFAMTDRGLRG